MCKIAILLTCHNRKETTLTCLKTLFLAKKNISDINFEIYLVDDGSIDGTYESIASLYPSVKLIKGDGNLYWNRGMNLAWRTASSKKYDYYLWLNDDVQLKNNSLSTIITDAQNLNNNSIICGACQSSDEKISYSGYKLKGKRLLEPEGKPVECDYFNGNVVLIPRLVFEKVGFLDPIYHHGQGDFDYGLRAGKMKIKSFISSSVVGTCDRDEELPVWCNPEYSLYKRIKHFKGPHGGRPKLTFIFQRKHIGLIVAAFHYFTIHLRLIFPGLWKIKTAKAKNPTGH